MERGFSAGSVPSARLAAYQVRYIGDAAAIRARLERQRSYAAYAIGQLSPALAPLVACWEAAGPDGEGLVMYSRGGLGDAVFMSGEPAALDAILSLHQGPRHNFATFRAEHQSTVERHFKISNVRPMLRMLVDRAMYRPPLAAARRGVVVRRLTASDVRFVNRLYSTESGPAYYSGPHIEQGYYHGVYEERRLVAVAGTHVVSPEEGVAVVGNVFTHPAWRGLGYGTLATAATTAALLEHCRDVTLTVDPTNTPAVRAYVRLGYREETRLIESQVTRRSVFGLRPLVAGLFASWRGRSFGGEVVLRRRE